MLTLAASRLSMIALEKKPTRTQRWMETEMAHGKKN